MHPILFHAGSVLIPSYGALAAIGVLAALFLAQYTARRARVDPGKIWNLCLAAMFSGLVGERLVLVFANWSVLLRHPSWLFAIGMIHSPLLAVAGIAAGAAVAALYSFLRKMPPGATADALAAPLALGLAFEQIGALLAGSGFGTVAGAKLPWAVTYTSALAAQWSGAPLGIPLHPVQAYAAIGLFALAVFLLAWMPARRHAGDVAGLFLLGLGAVVYFTEMWRAPEGRGLVFGGAIDGPQIAAVLLVMAGGLALRERRVTMRTLSRSPEFQQADPSTPLPSAQDDRKDAARRQEPERSNA